MSGHKAKVEICSSCTQPVHVDVCNFPIDYSYSETQWCVKGAPLVRVSQWKDAAQVITWQDAAGVIASPSAADLAGATHGACPIPPNDFEVIERFVCAAGTTIVRRETFNNGASTGVAWFGLNGAAVVAPAAFTEGACEGQTLDLEVEYVCAAGVTLVRRRIINTTTGALVSEVFIGSNGATVAAPAAYTEGQCVVSDSEVITDMACAAGVQVLRQQTWTNGVLTATNWFGANGAAIAAPALFTWGACPTSSSAPDNELMVLCDTGTNPPTPYIRRAIVDPITAVVTWSNLNISTGAAYVPITPNVCDGYQVVVDETCVLDTATGLVTSAKATQVWRYGVTIGAPVITNSATGAVITIAGTLQQHDCSIITTDLIPFCRTDTGAVVIRKVVSVAGAEVFSEWIDPITNATIAAPPAAVLTQDCDTTVTVESACFNIAGVIVAGEIRRVFLDGNLISTTFTRLDTNAVVVAPAVVPCSTPAAAVNVLKAGVTINATTTAAVTATRVALADDVIYVKATPTTASLANSTTAFAANAAVTVPATAIPVNARSVTVYNVTRARVTFTISSHGTVQIPANGTYTFNLPDNVPPYSGTYTIGTAAGNAGPNVFGIPPQTIVNWGIRV